MAIFNVEKFFLLKIVEKTSDFTPLHGLENVEKVTFSTVEKDFLLKIVEKWPFSTLKNFYRENNEVST